MKKKFKLNLNSAAVIKWIGYAATALGIGAGLISTYVDKQERKQVIAEEVNKQLTAALTDKTEGS